MAARRPQLIVFAILALACWWTTSLFVGAGDAARLRGQKTAMLAAKKAGSITKLTKADVEKRDRDGIRSPSADITIKPGPSNEIAIVTPPVSSEGIQGYLSLNVIFFFGIAMSTAGGLIEIQRFFPDATYF